MNIFGKSIDWSEVIIIVISIIALGFASYGLYLAFKKIFGIREHMTNVPNVPIVCSGGKLIPLSDSHYECVPETYNLPLSQNILYEPSETPNCMGGVWRSAYDGHFLCNPN